jgi:NAD-dependent dihydropyrimidine dehydrogenase PreA subunit
MTILPAVWIFLIAAELAFRQQQMGVPQPASCWACASCVNRIVRRRAAEFRRIAHRNAAMSVARRQLR